MIIERTGLAEYSLLAVRARAATVVDITQTTMFGIPVDTTVPVTTLTIKSVMEDEFDQG